MVKKVVCEKMILPKCGGHALLCVTKAKIHYSSFPVASP